MYDAEGTFHSHSCACGEVYTAQAGDCKVCAGFPWGIVCILEAVVFGGVIVFLVMPKNQAKEAVEKVWLRLVSKIRKK